ncbi:hypothetical protein J6590_024558 [Homalodisca vitripennis]|nr:hypothetical protein J6590_024558 [Homalodisca vitripennis]
MAETGTRVRQSDIEPRVSGRVARWRGGGVGYITASILRALCCEVHVRLNLACPRHAVLRHNKPHARGIPFY